MLEITEAGRYDVRALYACPEAEAGSSFEIRVDDQSVELDSRVRATGSWADFAEHMVGTVEFEPGPHVASIHGSKPDGPLIKLRSLQLTPIVKN